MEPRLLMAGRHSARGHPSDHKANNAYGVDSGADKQRTFTGSRRPRSGLSIVQPVPLGEILELLGDAVNEGSPARQRVDVRSLNRYRRNPATVLAEYLQARPQARPKSSGGTDRQDIAPRDECRAERVDDMDAGVADNQPRPNLRDPERDGNGA